jgi:hypothetical protein
MSKRKNPKNPSLGERTGSALSRRDFLKIAGVAAGAAAVSTAIPGGVLDAAGKPPVTQPTISCVPNGTDGASVIDVTVCAPAGGTGLPAGFSVQWMTCDDYAANGNAWFASDDPRLCKASFSGNTSGTTYNLAAGTCLTVFAGSFELNNPQGYSTTCEGPLDCDTCYVFRAFGHATSKLNRSADSTNCESTTDDCPATGFTGCTKSQGYFRNAGSTDGTDDCAVANLGANNPVNGVTFTSGAQAAAYLAQTGPGSPSALQKQLLGLALNIAVSDGGCTNYCDGVDNGPYPAGFGAAVICGIVDGVTPLTGTSTFPTGSAAALNGQTVDQVFDTVNGSGTYGLSTGNLTALLDLLNLSFDVHPLDDGTCCGASTFGQNHLFVGSCPP